MIFRIPQLALKRLVIQSRGIVVYDEKFRHGINIIRGTNSSGKSTIADFIFYVLGGELAKFKDAAERCSEVFAEIEVNGKPTTIRRMVEPGGKQPMVISFNDFVTATKSPVEGWQIFSMVRSATKESASQVLFRLLGFPEVKTDTENNITMHQVLRLIYADQLSAPSSLMRDERFDPPLIRQTVEDLLFGVYDDALFGELRELREKKAQLDAVSHQLAALYDVLGGTEIEVDEKALNEKLKRVNTELNTVTASLKAAGKSQFEKAVIETARKNIERLGEDLRSLQVQLSQKTQEIDGLELEIADSAAFIEDLKMRVLAIDDSLATRYYLGELPLTHCPQCLSELKKDVGNDLCSLCGNPLPHNPNDSRALKMKQELGQQLKESQTLYDDKIKAGDFVRAEIPKLEAQIKQKRRQYEDAVEHVRPQREDAIDRLFVRKGELMAEIENLSKQLKTAAIVKSFEANKAALTSLMQSLNLSIERRKRAQQERRIVGKQAIEEKTISILKKDLPRQPEFAVGKQVEIDFGANTFSLDGKNNFSASSVAYLKNSVHFGIFFASLELDFFRYPRFIMCDNIEDKGLELDRSRNFQKVLVELSEHSQVVHQIIFTTSMIDPSLNNDKYCVGIEYSDIRKSLNFHDWSKPMLIDENNAR